jgi:hypothetical protein
VKQGCPLLFHLCLKPLLQVVTTTCEGRGAFVASAEDRIEFTVQAYADDIIVILKETNGVRSMLEMLERSVN